MMEEGLIEYLQKYADELEAQAGAPDPEIRAKINELKVCDFNQTCLINLIRILTAGNRTKRFISQRNLSKDAGFTKKTSSCLEVH